MDRPNNKVKTLKALQGNKKNGATLHPHSRRAKQLERVALRTKKLDHQQKNFKARQEAKMDRHMYFIETLPEDATELSLAALHQLVVDYIDRHSDELAKLADERQSRSWRKAESKSKRESEIELTREHELAEYKAGFVLPDLTDAGNVRACREWARLGAFADLPGRRADPGFFARIKLVAIDSEDVHRVVVAQEGAKAVLSLEGEGQDNDGDQMQVTPV